MAFRAVHEQWGTVFAHLPDPGCGRAWADVWQVRPSAHLVCAECRHRVRAKVSPTGLRFFAHAPGAPECATAGESMAHHLLKLELATAARATGAHCEMEARGPEGVWPADVMASDPGGTWRVALEAQLSPITPDAIAARTERMRVNDVRSVWFSDRLRPPWLGLVPSVRLVTDEGGSLVVAEGLARFAGGFGEAGPQVPLAEFLGWVFADRAVPYRRIVQRTLYQLEPLFTVWTAPRYVRAEAAYREERDHREQERWEAERHQAAPPPRSAAGATGPLQAGPRVVRLPATYFAAGVWARTPRPKRVGCPSSPAVWGSPSVVTGRRRWRLPSFHAEMRRRLVRAHGRSGRPGWPVGACCGSGCRPSSW